MVPLNIDRWPIMSLDIESTWFTADTHFGHKNIIEYCNRPFSDVDMMNAVLIDNWNAVVDQDDTVFLLGDVALGPIHDSLKLIKQLHGYKILIAGNHDRCWQGLRRYKRWIDEYMYAGFSEIYDRVQFDLPIVVGACHFPGYDETDCRFPDWRPIVNPNQYLIHGHCHTAWHTRNREYNVGVDVNNYTPVTASTVLEYFYAYEATKTS